MAAVAAQNGQALRILGDAKTQIPDQKGNQTFFKSSDLLVPGNEPLGPNGGHWSHLIRTNFRQVYLQTNFKAFSKNIFLRHLLVTVGVRFSGRNG